MVFYILEAHRALDFGDRVDECAQRIAGQRMIVAAGADVIEFVRLVEPLFGIDALEYEALDFVCRIERVAVPRTRLSSNPGSRSL
jgi:hypothetical protein